MIDRVEEVIEKQIRPFLAAEGGFIRLVAVENGKVIVRMGGACLGCPMSQYTIKNFVETILKDQIPEVKEVVLEE